MIIEKNDIEIPEYLNEEFFKAALKKGLQVKTVEIISINYTMGSSGGENFCSFIYRVVIIFSTPQTGSQSITFIVKSMPTDGERSIVEDMKVYEKETIMYFDLLPKIESQLKNVEFAPKCFYAIPQPIQTIVFEDLNVRGYRIADREKGLDEHHTAVLLKKLGQFHAASMLLAEKNPKIMDKLPEGLFNKRAMDTPLFQSMFGDNLKCTTKLVETWPGYESIAAKLKNLQDTFLKKANDILEPTSHELKVVNHGDLWVNNFLYKYDNTEAAIDVLFIDFQGSFYTSPGIDINYLLYTSVRVDVLETRRDFLLESCYYKSFKSVLQDARYHPIPTFDDIVNEIGRKEFFGFFAAVGVLALICMDKESSKDNSIASIVDEELAEKKRIIACSTKRYQDMMRYMLKRFDKNGVFDN